jgi:hypothetical protein
MGFLGLNTRTKTAVSLLHAVSSFSTTFLLNRTGKVLLRDIKPGKLEKFLAAKPGK